MTEQWDGRPKNPEQDSEGHVWRVDGDLDIFSWVAARQWYEDRRGRWAMPADLIADNDVYYGQIITPAERNQLRSEVLLLEAVGADAADEIDRLREALRDCVETWRPLLADADLTAHENPAYLTLMHADLVLGEDRE